MKKYSFTFKEKLRNQADINKLFKANARFFSHNFIVYIYPNNLKYNRLAISVKRKIAKAVRRNRMKRLIREFFRLNNHIFKSKKYDILIIVKNDFSDQKLQDISKELLSLWQKFA